MVLLNPAASQAVRPTSSFPALTSRAGASLSFVFPTRPAASRQPPRTRCRSSQSQPRSSEHTGAPELREMLGGARSRLTDSVCLFQGAGPRSARSPVQVARQPPRAHSRSSRSQSAVSRVQSTSPPAPPCRWPASRQSPRACSRSSRSAVSSMRSEVRPLPHAGGYRFLAP